MNWIFAYLGVAGAWCTCLVCMMAYSFYAGKWQITESGEFSKREWVNHWLGIVIGVLGPALVWPLSLASMAITFSRFDLDKIRAKGLDAIETIDTGAHHIPPQDARSKAQIGELEARLRAELQASLGVAHLVRFYPLLLLSWEEFRAGIESGEGGIPTGQLDLAKLDAFFMAFAQGMANGTLKGNNPDGTTRA